MSTEVLFWTQIGSIVTLVFAVFGLYRLLVEQKESTIQLLKETISSLKEQLTEARSKTPDVLAQSLSGRVKLLEAELERLSQDQSSSKEEIAAKEQELRNARHSADELLQQLSQAKELLEDFSCPKCGAPLARLGFHSELVEYNGREIDVDHEYTEFECGYATADGDERYPCKGKHPRQASIIVTQQGAPTDGSASASLRQSRG